jgi:hypothetical protein
MVCSKPMFFQPPVRGPLPASGKFLPIRKTFSTKGFYGWQKVIPRIEKLVSEKEQYTLIIFSFYNVSAFKYNFLIWGFI